MSDSCEKRKRLICLCSGLLYVDIKIRLITILYASTGPPFFDRDQRGSPGSPMLGGVKRDRRDGLRDLHFDTKRYSGYDVIVIALIAHPSPFFPYS